MHEPGCARVGRIDHFRDQFRLADRQCNGTGLGGRHLGRGQSKEEGGHDQYVAHARTLQSGLDPCPMDTFSIRGLGGPRTLWRYTSQRTRLSIVNTAMPAMMPIARNWMKPCNDDASPRSVGNRSSRSSVTLGITVLEPIANTKSGRTCHGTPGG